MRIRSSILKEALDEKQATYGGPWKLIHLKGTELVADGCTKPLNGQAFFRFLEDLGLPRGVSDGEEHQVSNATSTKENSGGGGGFAAVKALVIGSALMSSAQGAMEENEDDIDYTPLLVTGTVLMALGAIYAGQVIHSASSYCLRRLCGPEAAAGSSSKREDGESSSGDESVLVVTDDEPYAETLHQRKSMSKKREKRSGSGAVGSTSQSSKTPSGFAVCASSMPLRTHSGLSSEEPRRSDVGDGGSAGASLSLRMTRPSGSGCAAGSASSSDSMPRSGSQLSAGDPAGRPCVAAGSLGVVDEEGRPKGSQGNPWNLFQQRFKGMGMTSIQIAKVYREKKSKGTKMP